eukprot:6622051-Lingulodinium_polyedra.AAC.1
MELHWHDDELHMSCLQVCLMGMDATVSAFSCWRNGWLYCDSIQAYAQAGKVEGLRNDKHHAQAINACDHHDSKAPAGIGNEGR